MPQFNQFSNADAWRPLNAKCQMLVISPNLLIELKMVQLSSQVHFVHLFIFGLFHNQLMSFQLNHLYKRSKLQFAKLPIRHILNLRCLMQYAYWQKNWDHTTPLECVVSFLRLSSNSLEFSGNFHCITWICSLGHNLNDKQSLAASGLSTFLLYCVLFWKPCIYSKTANFAIKDKKRQVPFPFHCWFTQ